MSETPVSRSGRAVRLALFDIDGTILWSDGAGRRAFGAALSEVFGDIDPGDFRFDGKTDRQIGRELLRMAGHADERTGAFGGEEQGHGVTHCGPGPRGIGVHGVERERRREGVSAR